MLEYIIYEQEGKISGYRVLDVESPTIEGANSLSENGIINENYTGQLDDIQVWDYAFTKEQVADMFNTESNIPR